MKAEDLIIEGVSIVDVRTPMEYMGGHVMGSINIPLQEIPERVEEFRNLNGPIVLCCASGARSSSAVSFLREKGIACENGGAWTNVNYIKSII